MSANLIFNVKKAGFLSQCLASFRLQYEQVTIYRNFCHQIGVEPSHISRLEEIPFLPISFFKTHSVVSNRDTAQLIFTSSGTSGQVPSRHYVTDISLYEASFSAGFRHFFGEPDQYAIFCLLPSYLERTGSSLVYMASKLIEQSNNPQSGFFLESTGALQQIIAEREMQGQKSILLGVTFALLDFAAKHPMELKHAIVMETGGMKGRRAEMTRAEMHQQLCQAFNISEVFAEYGMTELLSQAYSTGKGIFVCPPWMQVLVRPEDDPFLVKPVGTGILCIVDLANQNSCSFIETGDLGRVHPDGSFEVLGRMDHSEMRGCSLLAL